LFSVFPDVAELLAVVALSKAVMGSVGLHPDRNVAEAWQTENFWDFAALGKVMRKRGRFVILGSSGDGRQVVFICLTLSTLKLRFTSPSDMSSSGVLCVRWRITAFIGFSDFGKKVM
jgi:hypothetical protein